MFRASVYVTPKQGIADPQGATVERALPALGFEGVNGVRIGRFITLDMQGDDEAKAREELDAMCRRLLANPIIEDYWFELARPGAHDGHEGGPSAWTAADPYASREEEVE
jgi:phosphoribosylformylglycinamidine synthase subunit PurS